MSPGRRLGEPLEEWVSRLTVETLALAERLDRLLGYEEWTDDDDAALRAWIDAS